MRNTLLLTLVLSACAAAPTRGPASDPGTDPYLWLEDRTGADSLAWVKKQNDSTLATLQGDAHYAGIESDVRKIALATDRLPAVTLIGGALYNFWQDDVHVKGIWRRTSPESYATEDVKWETVLDLDALAKDEKEDWVWSAAPSCLAPRYERCLVSLSRGGKDAVVVRELDLATKKWVEGGFTLPEAKSQVSWIDENDIYVATDFGPGTMSTSGYAIVTKQWARGTPLSAAREVFRGQVSDVSAQATAVITPEGTYRMESRAVSFFASQDSLIGAGGKVERVPFPETASFQGIYGRRLIYMLRDDLKIGAKTIPSGSAVALRISALGATNALSQTETIFTPTKTAFLSEVSVAQGGLILDVLDNVHGKIYAARRTGAGWKLAPIPMPGAGAASTLSADPFGTRVVVAYTDFLTPSSILFSDIGTPGAKPTVAKQAPARFDASPYVSEQWFATSKDGTNVPYFVVHKKGMALDGKNPTLQYGYGGFERKMTPSYLSAIGKAWLERGGVYVLTNIRGGGEFGPAWHQAAVGVNRQKAYDDFIAISEDLIARKVTSPAKLAIQGGSNGGLLMGATFVERPDLYRAVLCEVPLLDMIRYTQIGAGASWIGEYGNPADPVFRAALLKYSPYQNLKPGAAYPEVFFLTNTSDDRVTPAHARKLNALMQSYGYPTFFYENTDGGHAGNANVESTIRWEALEFTYLWRKLGE